MSIHVIYGCMFAGKTTKLLEIISNLSNFIVFKPTIDTRSQKCIKSHNGKSYPAGNFSDTSELYYLTRDYENIIIDEGQFAKDLALFCENMRLLNKKVYIAGLDLTFDKKSFGDMGKIIKIADTKTHLKAQCKCGKSAIFTARTTHEKKKIIIGSEMYIPTCSTCWNKSSDKSSDKS